MKFVSLEPFVPSGKDYERSRQLFQELGFTIAWDGGDYTGFEKNGCRFILQKYDNRGFAENFMLSVHVDNLEELRDHIIEKDLVGKFDVRVGQITLQPYGRELNLIDIAGVCWHFVEQRDNQG